MELLFFLSGADHSAAASVNTGQPRGAAAHAVGGISRVYTVGGISGLLFILSGSGRKVRGPTHRASVRGRCFSLPVDRVWPFRTDTGLSVGF